MGRKSIAKKRKPLTRKSKIWVRELVPKVQNKSINDLTLDDLADLMGKSKSTIYSYFATKEEIYQTAVYLILEDLKYVISDDAIEGDDMEQVLRSILLRISDGVAGLTIGFLEQIKVHFPQVWLIIEEFTSRLLANLERIYIKGMQAGTFKKFNLSLLIALDRHFVMSVMTNTSLFSDQELTLKDLVNEYIELRLSALRVG